MTRHQCLSFSNVHSRVTPGAFRFSNQSKRRGWRKKNEDYISSLSRKELLRRTSTPSISSTPSPVLENGSDSKDKPGVKDNVYEFLYNYFNFMLNVNVWCFPALYGIIILTWLCGCSGFQTSLSWFNSIIIVWAKGLSLGTLWWRSFIQMILVKGTSLLGTSWWRLIYIMTVLFNIGWFTRRDISRDFTNNAGCLVYAILERLLKASLQLTAVLIVIIRGIIRIGEMFPIYPVLLLLVPTAYGYSSSNNVITDNKLVIMVVFGVVFLLMSGRGRGSRRNIVASLGRGRGRVIERLGRHMPSFSGRTRNSTRNNLSDMEEGHGGHAQESEPMDTDSPPAARGKKVKFSQRGNPPMSADDKKKDGHRAPGGKKPAASRFVEKHLRDKDPLPSPFDQSSEANNHVAKITKGLAATIQELKKVASEIGEAYKHPFNTKHSSAKSHYTDPAYIGTNLNDAEILFLSSFPPDDQSLETRGIFHTFRSAWDEESRTMKDVNQDSLPLNPSVNKFFGKFAEIMSTEFDVGMGTARKICKQISVWVDILPITLPYDSANNNGTDLYNTTRADADEHSEALILGIINNLKPHLKCIVIIGKEAFDFAEKMQLANKIPDHIKIINHSPISHPTKMFKYGLTKREAYWTYECLRDALDYLVPQTLKTPSNKEFWERVSDTFEERRKDDNTGCFIFKGSDDRTGADLFYTLGHTEMIELIRKYPEGSIPKSFPTFQDFIADPIHVFRELEVEMIWFENHDYSKKYGVQDEGLMENWVARAKDLQQEEWRVGVRAKRTSQHNERCGFVSSNRSDAFNAMAEYYP